MIRTDRAPRLAVLIDADNASPRIVAGLFEEIAKIGEASVRRIYGDFSSSRSQGWADVLARYAIIPQQQFAWVTGKNASDITLVIDAMDLLHSGRLDGFCLVSSDSDFTRLAARIREQGIDVFGFGEKKTPESFRQACRRFIYTENLLPERASSGGERPATRPLEQPGTASDLLRRVIDQMDTEDGWVSLGAFGKQIGNVSSDFDPRTFGFKKLSDLIRSTDTFEVDDADTGRIRVRLRPGARRAAGSVGSGVGSSGGAPVNDETRASASAASSGSDAGARGAGVVAGGEAEQQGSGSPAGGSRTTSAIAGGDNGSGGTTESSASASASSAPAGANPIAASPTSARPGRSAGSPTSGTTASGASQRSAEADRIGSSSAGRTATDMDTPAASARDVAAQADASAAVPERPRGSLLSPAALVALVSARDPSPLDDADDPDDRPVRRAPRRTTRRPR